MLKKVLVTVLVIVFFVPPVSAQRITDDEIDLKFYQKMMESKRGPHEGFEASDIGKRALLEGYSKEKSNLSNRTRPQVPWKGRLAPEGDDGKVAVTKEMDFGMPDRSGSIVFYGPTRGVLAAAHAPVAIEMQNEILKGAASLYGVAQGGTDPAISVGHARGSQLANEMMTQTLQADRAFRESLDVYPDLKETILTAYHGCITRHLRGSMSADGGGGSGDNELKSWIEAVRLCLGDSFQHRGAEFESLEQLDDKEPSYMIPHWHSDLAEINDSEDPKTWEICAERENDDMSGSYKESKARAGIFSVVNMAFCPLLRLYENGSDDDENPAVIKENNEKFEYIAGLRRNFLELFGDYRVEMGYGLFKELDKARGGQEYGEDLAVADLQFTKIPAKRLRAKDEDNSYPLEIYYEIKDARFYDLTELLGYYCEAEEEIALEESEVKKNNDKRFWNQVNSGARPEDAVLAARLGVEGVPFDQNIAARFLRLMRYREASGTCEKLFDVESVENIEEDSGALDVYSIYWNYIEFVAFDQLLETYQEAEQFLEKHVSSAKMNGLVLGYGLKLIYETAQTTDLAAARKENARLLLKFRNEVRDYEENYLNLNGKRKK